MEKMLTDKEAEYMDGHFRSFLQLLCEYFGMSEKDALREIELRVNLTRTKLLQKPNINKTRLNVHH